MEKSLKGSLRELSERQKQALEDMTAAMVNKMLHGPIAHLKNNGEREDNDETLFVAALKKLFDLEEK
jgi:glutamyl-tRNA reductase